MIRTSIKNYKRKKTNKFNAHKTVVDNIKFDSKAESQYYLKLKRENVNFEYHETFEIIGKFSVNDKNYSSATYTPDFTIYENGELVKVIDVKGGSATMTAAAKLRIKMFMKNYGLPVIIAKFDYRTGMFSEEQV